MSEKDVFCMVVVISMADLNSGVSLHRRPVVKQRTSKPCKDRTKKRIWNTDNSRKISE